jgi:hypothetical protein
MIQKILFTTVGLLALSYPCAHAEPGDGAGTVINRTLIGESAQALFAGLNVASEATELGLGKKFATEDGALRLSCRQDMDENAACAITVDRDLLANGVLILSGKSADDLYRALNVKIFAEKVSDVKIFADAGENVSILCARSLIPNGNPYACSVELSAR